MALIEIKNASVVFKTQKGEDFSALKNINLNITDGEFVTVVGSSGSGKTTLLNIIAGLLNPTNGKVLVDNKEVNSPGRDRGVIFQQDSVFMWRTVQKNIEFGLELQKIDKEKRQEIAKHYINMVGLDGFEDFLPKELSGGMKKRCQVATVLANDPAVLLMDEPYGALDYPTKCTLQKELLSLLDKEPKTTVFITHDIEEALFLGDRVICLCKGEIQKITDINIKKPREYVIRLSSEFTKLKNELWEVIDDSDVISDEAKR